MVRFQMLVTNIEHSEFVGRQALGRIERGVVRKGDPIACINATNTIQGRVNRMEKYEGITRIEVDEAQAGEIVVIAGLEEVDIGDSLTALDTPEALPRMEVEKPTVAVNIRVNDGPFAGKEGKFVTSRQIRERLYRQTLYDRALQVEDVTMDTFRVAGRGELHLGVLMETMRRGRLRVLCKSS